MRKTISIFIVVLGCCFLGYGQDCSTPLTLCSGTPESADSSQFSGAFTGTCFSSLNSIYYEFTTNNNTINPTSFLPYEVEATISVQNCTDAGVALDVTAGIYLPNTPGDTCGGLTEVAACVTDQNELTLNSSTLQPNTVYILIIGIDNATAGFACDLDVVVTGAPLEIDACCDANVVIGSLVSLQAFGGTVVSGSESYIWDNVGSLDDFQSQSPIAQPNFTTVYTVETNVGNCLVTDEVLITIEQNVNPHNAITPNGDGFNDTWIIDGIQNYNSALVSVYDRWGQLVFKSIGYTQPWDGTNEGKELSVGTYYYTIELNSLVVESEPITGYIVIIH